MISVTLPLVNSKLVIWGQVLTFNISKKIYDLDSKMLKVKT